MQVKLPFWCVGVWTGANHIIAVCENPDGSGQDYSTYAWGSAANGVLGMADLEVCNSPQLLRFLEGAQIASASFGCSNFGMAVVVRR
jgi:alpha-tubulin suppressor-like RCC1 family protein